MTNIYIVDYKNRTFLQLVVCYIIIIIMHACMHAGLSGHAHAHIMDVCRLMLHRIKGVLGFMCGTGLSVILSTHSFDPAAPASVNISFISIPQIMSTSNCAYKVGVGYIVSRPLLSLFSLTLLFHSSFVF